MSSPLTRREVLRAGATGGAGDHYFCSVIGPTDPNRLYTMSAWLDPAGTHGGPILSTSSSRVERYGTLSWTTMPEQLQARGITWKVYGSADGNFGDNVPPPTPARGTAGEHVRSTSPGSTPRCRRCRGPRRPTPGSR